MKKENLKSLSLNKKSVSNLNSKLGGNPDTDTDNGLAPQYTNFCSVGCDPLSISACNLTLPRYTNCASQINCESYGMTCECS
jgi:hypothetical protein